MPVYYLCMYAHNKEYDVFKGKNPDLHHGLATDCK